MLKIALMRNKCTLLLIKCQEKTWITNSSGEIFQAMTSIQLFESESITKLGIADIRGFDIDSVR